MREKYRLYQNDVIFEDLSQCTFPFEAGKILNEETGDRLMTLVYDRDAYRLTGYHFCTRIDAEIGPCIILDDSYLEIFRHRTVIFLALAMHELGHYLNGDFDRKEATHETEHELQVRRNACAAKGGVIPEELNADRFAAEIVGKSRMINALDYLARMRRARAYDPIRENALREFAARKRALQKLRLS